MEEELLEQIALEERRYREGKALAYDLICLGATNKEIGTVLGTNRSRIHEWRKALEEKGCAIRDLCEKSEIEGGLQQLAQYRGLYTQAARELRTRKKQEIAKLMLDRGAERKEITETLDICRGTLRMWEDEWRGKQTALSQSEKVWSEHWAQEWDEFMARLVRPIRLAR